VKGHARPARFPRSRTRLRRSAARFPSRAYAYACKRVTSRMDVGTGKTRLRAAIDERGLSLAAVGRACGVSRTAVAQWFTDRPSCGRSPSVTWRRSESSSPPRHKSRARLRPPRRQGADRRPVDRNYSLDRRSTIRSIGVRRQSCRRKPASTQPPVSVPGIRILCPSTTAHHSTAEAAMMPRPTPFPSSNSSQALAIDARPIDAGRGHEKPSEILSVTDRRYSSIACKSG
jgi:hypothetical protein